jgi:hypothetical protein
LGKKFDKNCKQLNKFSEHSNLNNNKNNKLSNKKLKIKNNNNKLKNVKVVNLNNNLIKKIKNNNLKTKFTIVTKLKTCLNKGTRLNAILVKNKRLLNRFYIGNKINYNVSRYNDFTNKFKNKVKICITNKLNFLCNTQLNKKKKIQKIYNVSKTHLKFYNNLKFYSKYGKNRQYYLNSNKAKSFYNVYNKLNSISNIMCDRNSGTMINNFAIFNKKKSVGKFVKNIYLSNNKKQNLLNKK